MQFGSQSIIALFHLRMEQFLPWGLWLLTELHFRLCCISSAFCRLGILTPLHTNCDCWLVRGWEAAKGQVSQRDIITQVGKYLRALFNDTILFFTAWGQASSLTASVSDHNTVWQKPFIYFCKLKINHGDIDPMVDGSHTWEELGRCE